MVRIYNKTQLCFRKNKHWNHLKCLFHASLRSLNINFKVMINGLVAMATSSTLRVFASLFLCWKVSISDQMNRYLEFSFRLALYHNCCWIRQFGKIELLVGIKKKWEMLFLVNSSGVDHQMASRFSLFFGHFRLKYYDYFKIPKYFVSIFPHCNGKWYNNKNPKPLKAF